MKRKRMTNSEADVFMNQISRFEFAERPVEYSKAVRVTLTALGFDEDWVNGEFRERLESTFRYYFDTWRD
jgi:hypothetical protein